MDAELRKEMMAIWPNLSQKTLDLLVTPHKCKSRAQPWDPIHQDSWRGRERGGLGRVLAWAGIHRDPGQGPQRGLPLVSSPCVCPQPRTSPWGRSTQP